MCSAPDVLHASTIIHSFESTRTMHLLKRKCRHIQFRLHNIVRALLSRCDATSRPRFLRPRTHLNLFSEVSRSLENILCIKRKSTEVLV